MSADNQFTSSIFLSLSSPYIVYTHCHGTHCMYHILQVIYRNITKIIIYTQIIVVGYDLIQNIPDHTDILLCMWRNQYMATCNDCMEMGNTVE